MRIALALVLVAACGPDPGYATPPPDAGRQPACYDNILALDSPLANQHYATDMIAVGELTGPTGTMVQPEMLDDAGNSYAFTGFDPPTQPTSLDRYPATWHWQLAPSRRYELTMWNCCDAICATRQDPIRVVFYTSP